MSVDLRQQFGRIAVLLGGSSSEREVSLDSGRNVLQALVEAGVDARPIDGVPALIEALQNGTVDRVFNVLHGSRGGGEDGVLQGLLDAYQVPYTGSYVLGSALAMDKVRSKRVWQSLGLPTADFCVLQPGENLQDKAEALGYPLIVKPACEGSSVGISRVFKPEDLGPAVELAKRYPGELLLERLIVGEELTVGVLGERALPCIRIVPAGEYYDYHAKYVAEDTQYICPGLAAADDQAIGALALAAFQAVGCRGWGRVDVMRDRQGQYYLLEVNTAPGMTRHSLVPKAAAQVGIGFAELCLAILAQTLAKEGGA